MNISGLLTLKIQDGLVLVGSDAHYWPGPPTTAHRAFVELAKQLKPTYIIMNGDVIDGSTISRHPPIGWEKFPTVQEEIEVAQERLSEIAHASPHSSLIWPLGNHDARYNTKLAQMVPEYKGVRGTYLRDHFPQWIPTWGVELGGKHGAIVKHRFTGGSGAAGNNALKSGRTIVTGHLHRLGLRAVTDYTGTRWGVEGGMLAEAHGPQFRGYTENNPVDWQSGFVVLEWRKGNLLTPDLVPVIDKNHVQYRGELIGV